MGTSVKEIKQNDRQEQVKYTASEEKLISKRAYKAFLLRGKLHYFRGARAAVERIYSKGNFLNEIPTSLGIF